jgi:hypothetical protein
MCVVFAIVAVWRLWVAFGLLVIAATAPLVGLLAVLGQGLAALGAAFALWNARQALGRISLVAFVLLVLLQMSMDAFGYGIRSLVEALTGTLVALVIAGVAWVALASGRPAGD